MKISGRYYSFGSPMPGRTFSSNSYRYGFNGKENDYETVSTGEGTQDYGLRIYNPALGKFLSVDPLTAKFPWYTPYQFAGNKPIWATDLDGAEENLTNGGNGAAALPANNDQACQAMWDRYHIPAIFSMEHIEAWQYAFINHQTDAPISEWNGQVSTPSGLKPYSELNFEERSIFYRRCLNCDEQNRLIYNFPEPNMVTTVTVTFLGWEEDGVGESGTVGSFVPFYGSGRDAINAFQQGKIVSGIGNSILTISDVFLLSSLVKGAGKGGIKALGKNFKTWKSYRGLYGSEGFAEANQELHHWALRRNGQTSGEGITWWWKNQKWNLMPMKPITVNGVEYTAKNFHDALHFKGPLRFNSLEYFYYGTPTWVKPATFSTVGHLYNGASKGFGFSVGF